MPRTVEKRVHQTCWLIAMRTIYITCEAGSVFTVVIYISSFYIFVYVIYWTFYVYRKNPDMS
jgi:hypothetical protein